MNVNEGVWMYMNQCDGIWKYMIVYECKWEVNECKQTCRKISDGIGIYRMVYGCICANMDVCESIWWYVNRSKWEYTKVHEAIWRYRDLYDGVWVFMPTYGCIWRYMMVYECKWQ